MKTKKTDIQTQTPKKDICVHSWVSLGETKDICFWCDKIRRGHWTTDKYGKLKTFIVDSIQ